MDKEVKKINIVYLLGYIFIPAIVVALSYTISYFFFRDGNMAVILLLGVPFIAILWYIFGGKLLMKKYQKQFASTFEEKNFKPSDTFFGRGCTVYVDTTAGNVGLLFFWNPFEPVIIPASRLTDLKVDDGKKGSGFMAGSSYVSFNFKVDNIKVRVYTFTSNQRWRMDSTHIVNGVAKAKRIVDSIEKAQKK